MRRSGIRGVLAGALGLVALQVLVSSQRGKRVAGLLGAPAAAARWFLDPDIPAIPQTDRAEARATRQDDDGQKSYPSSVPPAPMPVPTGGF